MGLGRILAKLGIVSVDVVSRCEDDSAIASIGQKHMMKGVVIMCGNYRGRGRD